MAQVKIYGFKNHLNKIQKELSNTIHACIVDVLSFPKEKKFQRFIKFAEGDMIFPSDKSEQYTIIEIIMIEGRECETKKNLIKALFEKIEKTLQISPRDIEICILESPASNWGFRGVTGDEIKLDYSVEV